MEKLINSAFDFFAYALPGCFMILALFILDEEKRNFEDYLNFAQNLKIGGVTVLLAAGYMTAFAVTPLGRRICKAYHDDGKGWFFRMTHHLLKGNLAKDQYEFDNDRNPEKNMPISQKYVLVRALTPPNFRYIESWHVYSLMSYNMALANILVIIFVLVRLVRFWDDCPWPWFLILAGAVFFALLFLFNAVKFNTWSMNEQNAAIEALHLRERPLRDPDPQPAGKSAAIL